MKPSVRHEKGASRSAGRDSTAVDRLNVALMLVAGGAAVVAPFHLFLFSYAVLGPLHYLTEISWLHDRGFFVPRAPARAALVVLVGVTSAVMLVGLVRSELLALETPPTWEIGLFLLVFVAAAVFQLVRHPVNVAALLLVTGLGLALVSTRPAYGLVAYLLMTIVHVFLFTGGFLVQGARRARGGAGLASCAVFGLVAAATLLVAAPAVPLSPERRLLYKGFEPLNVVLLRLAGADARDVYATSGLGVMRFIAFAYTYHYLNWFSKTSVIGWHEVGRSRALAIVALWVGGVALYVASYQLGFVVFYVLSAAHVMLEFPLNHRTFAGLFRPVEAR